MCLLAFEVILPPQDFALGSVSNSAYSTHMTSEFMKRKEILLLFAFFAFKCGAFDNDFVKTKL